jgi:transposase-like protein
MLSYEERAGEWRRRFDDQRSSGLTVSAWCRKRGITKNTFYGWRKRLAQPPAPGGSAPQFVAVAVERQLNAPAVEPSTSSASHLTLRVGRIVVEVASGFDPALLADVLGVLESRVSPC